MIFHRFALLAAATVQAFPQRHVPTNHTRAAVWTPPEGAINISGNWTLINKLKRQHGLKVTTDTLSSNPGGMTTFSGPCNQGDCPDWNAGFDGIYTWTQITQPGPPGGPPITIVWNDYDIRVNDCGQCFRNRVGYKSGCYDFASCGGRPQNICIDLGNHRAHRIWKDSGVKKCYEIQEWALGGCGVVMSRIISYANREIDCTW